MGLGSSTSSRSTAESGKCTADLQVATDTIKRLQESLDAGNHRWKEEMASAMKQITVLQQTIAEKQSEYQKSTDQLQQLLPCPQDLIKATQQNEVSKADAQLWMDKYNTELEPAKARLQDLEMKQLTGLFRMMIILETFLLLSGRLIVLIIKRNPFQTRLFFSEDQQLPRHNVLEKKTVCSRSRVFPRVRGVCRIKGWVYVIKTPHRLTSVCWLIHGCGGTTRDTHARWVP